MGCASTSLTAWCNTFAYTLSFCSRELRMGAQRRVTARRRGASARAHSSSSLWLPVLGPRPSVALTPSRRLQYGENLFMTSSTAFTKDSTSSVLDAVGSW